MAATKTAIVAFASFLLKTVFITGERCQVPFRRPVKDDHALVNHVIETYRDDDLSNCHIKCYINDKCESINYGTLPGGTRVCEVSSSNHHRNSLELVPKHGFRYYIAKNGCSTNPCINGGTCKPGRLPHEYTCVCPKGFKQNCDQDINECETGTHSCSIKANCINTIGSFKCICIDGYHGDGITCRGCPPDWHHRNTTGACYFLSPTGAAWNNATEECEAMGAWLVIVDNIEENDYLHYNLSVGSRWIGATDQEEENIWKDSKGQVLRYTNWRSGQPNNYKEQDCAITYGATQGKWDDAPCSQKNKYICEKSDEA